MLSFFTWLSSALLFNRHVLLCLYFWNHISKVTPINIVDKIANALIDQRFCFCKYCSTMRTALVLAGIIGIAVGEGFFSQQFQYKTSSSSYKNNELQHKTDDQGFYSKDGDLEGRTRPKVKSNSEHSEYVNPKLGQGGSGKFSFCIHPFWQFVLCMGIILFRHFQLYKMFECWNICTLHNLFWKKKKKP